MNKTERKKLGKVVDEKFILSLIIYAFGFAFICTTAGHIVVNEMFHFEISMIEWLPVILPIIFVLFLTYTFGSLVFLGVFAKKNK